MYKQTVAGIRSTVHKSAVLTGLLLFPIVAGFERVGIPLNRLTKPVFKYLDR